MNKIINKPSEQTNRPNVILGWFDRPVYAELSLSDLDNPIPLKTWYDPIIEIKAQKKVTHTLYLRSRAFGVNTEVTNNRIHIITENKEELEKLTNHPALQSPAATLVLGAGAKFIPVRQPPVWNGLYGMKHSLLSLFSRMLWGWHRSTSNKDQKIENLKTFGLQPCYPNFPAPRCMNDLNELISYLYDKGFPADAFTNWAEDVYSRAGVIVSAANSDPNSKAWRRVRQEQNLNHKHLLPAFKALRNASDTIGIGIADKNLGPTVYTQDLYDKLKEAYLNTSGSYIRIGDCTPENRKRLLDKQKEAVEQIIEAIPPHLKHHEGLRYLRDKMSKGAQVSHKLAGFYLIIKVHKIKPQANPAEPLLKRIPVRPIQPAIGTVLEHISKWLHATLAPIVFKHPYVLKNTEAWIERTKALTLPRNKKPRLLTMDVVSLYPSIELEDGVKALEIFLTTKATNIPKALHKFIIRAARAVLSENYIEAAPCGIYQQTKGTAMGTAFAVVYAIIFMIEFESPIVEKWAQSIALYGRFIDDAQTIWTGTDEDMQTFIHDLQTRNPSIKWEISIHKVSSQFLNVETTITPCVTDAKESWGFTHKVYRKELNAYAYLPYASYHGPHIPKAWIKAELYRLNMLCTEEEDYITAKRFFLRKLAERGYPLDLLREMDSTYTRSAISVEQSQTKRNKASVKIKEQNGCILSVTRVPYIKETLEAININPQLIGNQGLRDFYPTSVMVVHKNAASMSRLLPKCRKHTP